MCLARLPFRIGHEAFGAAQPFAGTVFTLVFIASALFLLTGNFKYAVEIAMRGVPLVTGVVLLLLAPRPWRVLRPQTVSAPAS
jgi:hypothetical protein